MGQIYHSISSFGLDMISNLGNDLDLISGSDSRTLDYGNSRDLRGLQIYFVDKNEDQINLRRERRNNLDHALLNEIGSYLNSCISYVRLFKKVSEVFLDAHEMILTINSDEQPSNEQSRRFNLLECNEVAVITSISGNKIRYQMYATWAA